MKNGELRIRKVAVGVVFLMVTVFFAFAFLPRMVRAEQVTEIAYTLPYPGMLPDSPLYFLKVIRDKVMVMIISDPVTKSFYVLSLADKRLAAGRELVLKKENSLAATTILEAENYFGQAVDQAEAAKKKGRDVGDLLAKLVTAGAKHGEIILWAEKQGSSQEASRLAAAYQQSESFRNRVNDVVLEKLLK